MICTYREGIVLRPVYHVFRLYNLMLDRHIDTWVKEGADDMLDIAATSDENSGRISIAVVNKDPDRERQICIGMNRKYSLAQLHTVNGTDADSCNTVGKSEVGVHTRQIQPVPDNQMVTTVLEPHSVNVITIL